MNDTQDPLTALPHPRNLIWCRAILFLVRAHICLASIPAGDTVTRRDQYTPAKLPRTALRPQATFAQGMIVFEPDLPLRLGRANHVTMSRCGLGSEPLGLLVTKAGAKGLHNGMTLLEARGILPAVW